MRRKLLMVLPGLLVTCLLVDSSALAQRQEQIVLGLEGYCPVAISETNQWQPGNALYRSWYDGVLYQFESFESRQRFQEDPGKYVPAYGGYCTGCMVEEDIFKQGSINFTRRYQGRLYLFPNDIVKEKFRENEEKYEAIGIGNNGNCIVASTESGKTVAGNPEFVEFHDNQMYHFESRASQMKFRRDPAQFVKGE